MGRKFNNPILVLCMWISVLVSVFIFKFLTAGKPEMPGYP